MHRCAGFSDRNSCSSATYRGSRYRNDPSRPTGPVVVCSCRLKALSHPRWDDAEETFDQWVRSSLFFPLADQKQGAPHFFFAIRLRCIPLSPESREGHVDSWLAREPHHRPSCSHRMVSIPFGIGPDEALGLLRHRRFGKESASDATGRLGCKAGIGADAAPADTGCLFVGSQRRSTVPSTTPRSIIVPPVDSACLFCENGGTGTGPQ